MIAHEAACGVHETFDYQERSILVVRFITEAGVIRYEVNIPSSERCIGDASSNIDINSVCALYISLLATSIVYRVRYSALDALWKHLLNLLWHDRGFASAFRMTLLRRDTVKGSRCSRLIVN